jgi:predicted DNA-binding protein
VGDVGRPKKFDKVLKIKVSLTQDAMLDHLSELLGLTKSQVVREMIDMEAGSRIVRRAVVEGLDV